MREVVIHQPFEPVELPGTTPSPSMLANHMVGRWVSEHAAAGHSTPKQWKRRYMEAIEHSKRFPQEPKFLQAAMYAENQLKA